MVALFKICYSLSFLDGLFPLFIQRTFNSSRAHGSLPLLAIDRYSEIEELVNRSLDLVELANITVSSITKKVKGNKPQQI